MILLMESDLTLWKDRDFWGVTGRSFYLLVP